MKNSLNDKKPEGFSENEWQAYLERKKRRAEYLASIPEPTAEEIAADIPKHIAEGWAEIAEFKKKHGIP
jgi:hypothetical protein